MSPSAGPFLFRCCRLLGLDLVGVTYPVQGAADAGLDANHFYLGPGGSFSHFDQGHNLFFCQVRQYLGGAMYAVGWQYIDIAHIVLVDY